MHEGTALEFTPETRLRWEWSPEAIRHIGHLVVELIAHHLTALPERPVFQPFPPELAVARHVQLTAKLGIDARAAGLHGVGRRLRVYTSTEGHSCIRKAVELLGLGSNNLRLVPVDAQRRMQGHALEAAIQQDLEAGHLPIAVAASAGTVNSGAIDPLAALRHLCDRYGLWLHVDGAYGAPAILSTRYRQELEPIAQADSVALDPHKWLYVPVEAGLVLIRDGQAMRDTFSLVPPYLRNDGTTDEIFGLPWFSEYGLQQTRGFRALKVWMNLKHHGLAGYTEAIERDMALAEHLASLVDASADLQRLAAGLSIVCFRYAPPPWRDDAERLNALNKALLETLQRHGQAFLSSTTLEGTFVLRACIINPRTTPADLEYLVALVRDLGAQLARDGA